MSKTYIQGGAKLPSSSGKKLSTKKSLKEAIATDPANVILFATSSMGPQFHATADQLPEDTEFNVVGPNPATDRRWYATVKHGRKGLTVT